MKAIINPNKQIKTLLKTVVGYVRVNQSWINHNNNYECAAWWEDSETQEGVYELTLEQNYFVPYHLRLDAKINAVVVDDFFPSLFGGVATSQNPYVSKRVGEKRIINKSFDIIDAIEKTGQSKSSDFDFCINPLIIDAVIESAKETLNNYKDSFNNYWLLYKSDGYGEYNKNISMIQHTSKNVADLAKAIDLLLTKKNYIQNSNDYMRQVIINNVNWINN